jgi:hypothetical protein
VKEPPKLLQPPKAKTLIEASGYQILTDATKAETEKWLDERKKAKHSVLWLDAYAVAGKPVFCAVAALDDREPDWVAMLDVPLKEMPPPAMRKRIDTESYKVRSLSGYADGDALMTVILWQPGVKRWLYRPCDVDMQKLKDELGQLAKQVGASAVCLRPIPTGAAGVRWGYYSELRLGNHTRHALALPADELTAFLDAQRKDGYRPIALAAADGGDGPVFGVVVEKAPDKLEWHAEWGLTADKVAAAAKARSADGFYPDVVTAYAWDGAVRYCVVWVKELPKKEPDKKP